MISVCIPYERRRKCDICGDDLRSIFIDGKARHGPWANMCSYCHANVGCGLGTGRGQKYELRNGFWTKIEG
jgi:hypothetical protein